MYGNVLAKNPGGGPLGLSPVNKGKAQAVPFLAPPATVAGAAYPLGISGLGGGAAGHNSGGGNLETYEVMHKFVALRSGPSVESKHLGRLEMGTRIRGRVEHNGRDAWFRLAPQKLPPLAQLKGQGQSIKEVNAQDEVWVLIDATNLGLNGLGVLLKRVESVEDLDEGDLTEWKVVHTQVAIRKEANLTSAVVGQYRRGERVSGALHMIGGVPWLRNIKKDERGGPPMSGWTLVDGGAVGLGPLLQQVFGDDSEHSETEQPESPKAKATAKAKGAPKAVALPPKADAESSAANARAKAGSAAGKPEGQASLSNGKDTTEKAKAKQGTAGKAKAKGKAKQPESHELGDLSRWIYHEQGRPGRFKVVHEQVVIRSMPSVKGKMKGIVMKGDYLQGEQRSEWLLLDWELAPLELLEGKGRWALIDGKSVGFGTLLDRIGDAAVSGSLVYQQGDKGADGSGSNERLPRVLCLPGAASGQAIFSIQLSFLARRAQGLVELVFIDGPSPCTDAEPVKIMSTFFRGKPMRMFDEMAFDERNWLAYRQPRSALKWLQEKMQELAPIDAVLGFSQGADFATMLAAQASKPEGAPLSCVVLLCPHAPGYANKMDDLFSTGEIKVPAFVMRGEQEDYDEAMRETLSGKVIDRLGYKMPSEHVIRLFQNPEVVTHRDGHLPLPQDKVESEKVVEQLLAFLLRHARKAGVQTGRQEVVSELRDGATVRLVGLEKVAHLNKQEGTLQRFDSETERWVVTLQSSGEQVMLKEKNLEVVKEHCVVCSQGVGVKRGENGERYCAKCWPMVSCRNCRKSLGTEKADDGQLYCTECWAKRMCKKCTVVLGEVRTGGERYCKKCWAEVSCADCGKAVGVKTCAEQSFCATCWQSRACSRCDKTLGTRIDPVHGGRFCVECWEATACNSCMEYLGDVRDVKGDNYCSKCWDSLSCVLCIKAVGTVKDSEGKQHCEACWERYRLCVRCRSVEATAREGNRQYCADCHYVVTLCVKCSQTTGEPRPSAENMRFCQHCWAERERERLEKASRSQAQLFRDLLGACEATPGPPMLPGRPGPPELPREAGDFLRRLNLGPVDAELPSAEPHVLPTPRPQVSPVQGTSAVDGGAGWTLEFTSAFDGGNASVDAWDLEPMKGGVPTFFTRVAPDFKANSASLRAFDQARQYWFFFGVRPRDPVAAIGARFRLKVGGMMRQEELFDNGYAPVCHSPSAPMWQRVEEGSVDYKREKDENGDAKNTMYISWLHTLQMGDITGTTYFAFCYPFSFADMQGCLARIEHVTTMNLGGDTSLIGCLHQMHQGCTYTPFGEHALALPVAAQGLYFHRQLFARSRQGRTIEMLTITEAPEDIAQAMDGPWDELPAEVERALDGWPSSPPLLFQERQICFASGRVHPGETPGQFAFLGLLQFLLSDDPRAALLRKRFVWKLIPMMNPDGVSWGHSRTNSLGFDLNRCYAQPTAEEHDVVYSVKVQLKEWNKRGSLCWYTDMHAHGKDRGCFLYGNLQESEEDFFWSVAYGHAVQLNCPHLDIDKCLWSTAPAPKADQPDYDSGRGQIGRCCKLPLAYTLECNYNTGRLCRPVPEPPALDPQYVATQIVRDCGVPRDPAAGGRFSPVTYDPCHWATVGEALAVSVLDMQAENPYSRLLVGRPPKLITEVGGRTSAERAHQQDVTRRLHDIWEELSKRHRSAGSIFS